MLWLLRQDARRKAIAAAILAVWVVGDVAYRLAGHALTTGAVLTAVRAPFVLIPFVALVVLGLSSQF